MYPTMKFSIFEARLVKTKKYTRKYFHLAKPLNRLIRHINNMQTLSFQILKTSKSLLSSRVFVKTLKQIISFLHSPISCNLQSWVLGTMLSVPNNFLHHMTVIKENGEHSGEFLRMKNSLITSGKSTYKNYINYCHMRSS